MSARKASPTHDGPEPRPPRVAVHGLSKAYGAVQAVADVSFEVGAGEVFGLLGPNGAGKTTTVEAVIGLTAPDAGLIEVCGFDIGLDARRAKQRLGAALQTTGLQDAITPREAVAAFAALYGRSAPPMPLLARFGLDAKADARVATLSGGQRQRLALALAFVNDPQVVVLDEPTVGLDPQMRREFHAHIRAMKAQGLSVLLTTHDMDEAAQLCDRIAVIDAGRIIASGAPQALIAGSQAALRVAFTADAPLRSAWFRASPLLGDLRIDGAAGAFAAADLTGALAQLAAALSAQGVQIVTLSAGKGTLEDVILEIVAARAKDR